MIVEDLTLIKILETYEYGDLYLSSKKRDNSYYATNVYKKSFLSKNDLYNRFLNNQISILLDTNHPNIIKLIEIKETKDKIFLVKEYYNGGTLRAFFEKNNKEPLSEEIIQYIMRQLIDAVKYLHNKKIIHRDLNLDDIIINYDDENNRIKNNIMEGKIKIFDLMDSCYLAKGELAQTILGNPAYMDPNIESVDGYDEKVDLWNLGMIFYELLIGKRPFGSIEKINKGYYFVPTSISKEALSFLNCMLQYESKKRKNADVLYNHPFLRKNVNNFTKIKEDMDKSEIKMNIKNNDYEILNVLNEFEANF